MPQQIPLQSSHISQATERSYKFSLLITILAVAATCLAVVALCLTFKS